MVLWLLLLLFPSEEPLRLLEWAPGPSPSPGAVASETMAVPSGVVAPCTGSLVSK